MDFDFEQRKSSSWQSEPGKQDAMRTWEVPFLNGRPGMTYLEAHREERKIRRQKEDVAE